MKMFYLAFIEPVLSLSTFAGLVVRVLITRTNVRIVMQCCKMTGVTSVSVRSEERL